MDFGNALDGTIMWKPLDPENLKKWVLMLRVV